MKSFFFLAVIFLSLSSFSQTLSPLVGTWKLVSTKITRNDTTQTYSADQINSLKIISPTHFAVFGQNSDGSFSHAAGGAATITTDTYTESIDYGNFTNMKGQKSVFKYEIKGNQLRIWGGVDGMKFDEVWTRVN